MSSATPRPITRRQIIRNWFITVGALLLYCVAAFLHLGGATSDDPLIIAVASVSFAFVGLVVWFCSVEVLADPKTRSALLGWCVAGCLAIVVWSSWTRPAGHAAIGIFLLLLLPILTSWGMITWIEEVSRVEGLRTHRDAIGESPRQDP